MTDVRITDALNRLVELHVPAEAGVARQQQMAELCKRMLASRMQPSVVADVSHVSDLIKKKLLKDNQTPEEALRFSNLYSRLQTSTVLHNKWAILYLLYNLSNNAEINATKPETHDLNAAFSYMGLHKIPERTPDDPVQPTFPSTTSSRPAPTKTKAQLLADYRQQRAKDHAVPSEMTLLRDIPFTLQGLPSTHLPFSKSDTLSFPANLPPPLISLLHSLAEPALLYRRLNAFVSDSDKGQTGGLVGQSFRAALGAELTKYLGLVAAIEGEIRRELADTEDNMSNESAQAGITLKRCVAWTREATMGLRLMLVMVEAIAHPELKGGQLISAIHDFGTHGDPFVNTFAQRLVTKITLPFYEMLCRWIYDGELLDPYEEFFVRDAEPNQRGAVWNGKYVLQTAMIPGFMSEALAKKVFLSGKNLNFLRYQCGDAEWVERHSREARAASDGGEYGDISGSSLEASIDKAYTTTTSRLMDLMRNKFHLFHHLGAYKRYLLLGQGDFIALLMETLGDSLEKPAILLHRHNLTSALDTAIRESNAQYEDADVLRRLDARMLELSHGETGWDVFTLEYKVESPVDVVVTPECARGYLRVFNFLWSIKRVEYALAAIWRKTATGARGVLRDMSPTMRAEWMRARCLGEEMVHFVCQLQYYILFEVLESSWDTFQAECTKPDATLDTLIQAHATYISSITQKGLLDTSRLGKANSFLSQLHEIFKTILAHKDAMDALYTVAVNEFTRVAQEKAEAQSRTARGEWGYIGASSNQSQESSELDVLSERLNDLKVNFSARLQVLLGDLAYQADSEMRFLGVRLNYNEFYQLPQRRPRTSRKDESGKGRERTTTGDEMKVAA
ncbi:Microtubule-nucleating Tub4p (gamma-tubulin) complex component [Saitoella coloradoensis]